VATCYAGIGGIIADRGFQIRVSLANVKKERDFLKEAAAYFAKESK
jgi:hypothetical protein